MFWGLCTPAAEKVSPEPAGARLHTPSLRRPPSRAVFIRDIRDNAELALVFQMVSCRGCPKTHPRQHPRQAGVDPRHARPRYFVSAQDRPIFTATRSRSGAPGKVAAKAAVIASCRRSAARSASASRHFQHDLVVRRRDRAALDPRLEQSRVDHRQRQHEGVGAGALDRQIEALGVAVAFRIPVDLVDAPALAPDRDAAAALAGARESPGTSA